MGRGPPVYASAPGSGNAAAGPAVAAALPMPAAWAEPAAEARVGSGGAAVTQRRPPPCQEHGTSARPTAQGDQPCRVPPDVQDLLRPAAVLRCRGLAAADRCAAAAWTATAPPPSPTAPRATATAPRWPAIRHGVRLPPRPARRAGRHAPARCAAARSHRTAGADGVIGYTNVKPSRGRAELLFTYAIETCIACAVTSPVDWQTVPCAWTSSRTRSLPPAARTVSTRPWCEP